MVVDACEQTLGAWTVAGLLRQALDRHEILGPGEYEGVLRVVVDGCPLGGLAADPGYAQAPAETEGPAAVTGAVDEAQLWLKAVATGWQGDGDSEVTRSRMKIRRELLP